MNLKITLPFLLALTMFGCALEVEEDTVTEQSALQTFNRFLPNGSRLFPGDKIVAWRAGGDHIQSNVYLVMQSDCNMVLYSNGTAMWHTNTVSSSLNCYAVMQSDGNFVLYRDGVARWQTNTVGAGPTTVVSLHYIGSGKQMLDLARETSFFCIYNDNTGCPSPKKWLWGWGWGYW
jgi:hypothetical protein